MANLDTSIATASGTTRANLEAMKAVPSAFWIDRKDKIWGTTTNHLQGILADAALQSPPPLVVFMLYDLPNRDCHAVASNGEICCHYKPGTSSVSHPNGQCDFLQVSDCADGLNEYKTQYVDQFAAVLALYDGIVPTAVVIEPDSLPNLVTNNDNPKCGNTATSAAYSEGIAYAVHTLAAHAPSAALYMDAAHGGWLGWEDNAISFATQVAAMGISHELRGFASNVANYQALGAPCPIDWDTGVQSASSVQTLKTYCLNNQLDACCADACGLLSQWSGGNNEYNYVALMTAAMKHMVGGTFAPHWLIDTGRNGVADMRTQCANWCNPRDAGAGALPTHLTLLPDVVDA
eukprot:5089580-Prymnesium_polylepis.1